MAKKSPENVAAIVFGTGMGLELLARIEKRIVPERGLDAGVIEASDVAIRAWDRIEAIDDDGSPDRQKPTPAEEAGLRSLVRLYDTAVAVVAHQPARGAEGLRAKVRLLRWLAPEPPPVEDGWEDYRAVLSSLFDDVERGA